MAINLTATTHSLELITTGAGAVHVVVSFIDDDTVTPTGGSQSSIISSATTTTIVSAPGASTTRSVHHISVIAVAGNTVTFQKDVSGTNNIMIGPITLAAGERIEFTSSAGWKRTDSTGSSIAVLAAIADDTFLANISGSLATPIATALTTLAGAGLTGGADAILNVGAGTGITVNANDIAINQTFSPTWTGAHTFSSAVKLANLENITTTGTITDYALIATTNRLRMGGGAGDRLLVSMDPGSSPDGRLVIIQNIDGTSDDDLVVQHDDGATGTAAMRFICADQKNARIGSRGMGIAVYDSTSSRWYLTVIGQELASNIQRYTTSGLSSDLVLNSTTRTLEVDSGNNVWSIDGIAGGYAGRKLTIRNSSNTASTGTIVTAGFSVSTAANQIQTPGNVNRGGYSRYSAELEYDGVDSTWRIVADVNPTMEDLSQTFLPPLRILKCLWNEDFQFYTPTSLTGIVFCGSGNWYAYNAGSAGGSITFIAGELNHPGIIRLTSHTVSGNLMSLHRGSSDGPTSAWVAGTDVREINVVARLVTDTSVGFFIGLSEDPSSLAITGTGNSHIAGFFFDTAGAFTDTTIHCITRESDGTAVDTDSNIAPGVGFRRYTIRQTSVGTIEFLIDSTVVATHSTQVPDSELMNYGFNVTARSAAARSLDVDYADFESHVLTR